VRQKKWWGRFLLWAMWFLSHLPLEGTDRYQGFLGQNRQLTVPAVNYSDRLFPLLLSGTAFNWFTSLTLGSVDMCPNLKHKFDEYFYNEEVELRLSDLTIVRQQYNETALEYLKRFREIRNDCDNLTIGEKDGADLAFAGLASYLKEKMEGQEFPDKNQVLQRAMLHENRAIEH
jgi:hypothetical protein